ncbi:MAG: ParB/RepB/Spo0J family partition protein [Gammaproteobacteria bacterium]|nr:MAG: ParB/RepB/Spo0J family partition protein [Gammaproteobacteria bacterium]
MAARKRGLGDRGLSALLTGAKARTAQTPVDEEGELRQLPVDLIQRGVYQPRRDMDPETLEELAQSIRAQGVMQPIVVRPIAEGRYEIIAGERRWRATQLAGLDSIPALVKDVPDEAAIAMALIENIQRENLNPIEEAMALKRLQDEFELSQKQVAEAVGKSRTTITNLMRLMNLEADTRTLLERGDLEMGHARALLGLAGREQVEAARQVVARGLSVRQTEALVRKLQQATPDKAPSKPDPDVLRLQNRLADTLGAKVRIDHGPKGKGKLVIEYSSLDELDGILAHIH